MELYGEGSDTTEKRTFRVVGLVSIDKIISPKVRVVDILKSVITRPRFPKVEIGISICL